MLVVHVAAVASHVAVDDVVAGRRRADDADHGLDGELDLVEGREPVFDGDLLRAVPRGLEQRPAVVVGRDGALVGDLQVQDIDDEHITGLGSLDVDRASRGVGDVVAVVEVGHGDGLVRDLVREAVERLEQHELAWLCGVARLVVLRELVHLRVDDLHRKLLSRELSELIR